MRHVLKTYNYETYDVNIVRGQGCFLYDEDEKKYIDFEAGVWATALGHSDSRINNAISKQLEKIAHLGYRYNNPIVEEAAQRVLEVVGIKDGRCTFLCSGSEAVEFGVQVIRRISSKQLLLGFAGSFLSSYGSSGKKSDDEWYLFDWSECADCPFADECNSECHKIKGIPFENIGGFVFEPGNTSGLVKLPPKALINTLERIVRGHDGVIIANEVTTGFGRTGEWFGHNHYGMKPDIISMGKSIGNGYPVSAVAMTEDIAQAIERVGFRYAQSHQNDALGCAVASEVIKVIMENNLIERGNKIGSSFKNMLEHLANMHECIKEVRGRGLMLVIEFKADMQLKLSEIHKELFHRGYLVGFSPAANIFRFYPALVIGESDISEMVNALDDILKR